MNDLVDIATLAFIVGGIMVLARPGSQGPALIGAIGSGFSSVLGTATGSSPAGTTNVFSGSGVNKAAFGGG
jgi:hypothetical protein